MTEKKSDAVEVSGARLERHRELIAISENICVRSWCEVDDGLAIVDNNTNGILHFSLRN